MNTSYKTLNLGLEFDNILRVKYVKFFFIYNFLYPERDLIWAETCSGDWCLNPLNAELNPIRHLLALVGARHIVHVSRIRVNCEELCWRLFIGHLAYKMQMDK